MPIFRRDLYLDDFALANLISRLDLNITEMPHLDVGSILVIRRVIYLIVPLCRGDRGKVRPCAFLFFAVYLANGGYNKVEICVGFQIFNVIGGRIGREQIRNFRIFSVFYTIYIVALYIRPSGGLVGLRPGKAHSILTDKFRFQIVHSRRRGADV